MARPITHEGIQTRLAIRAGHEAHPNSSLDDLRRKFNVPQKIVDSALGKTVAEWQALLDSAPLRESKPRTTPVNIELTSLELGPQIAALDMSGLEQGIIKFTCKPAKMGDDHILWVPRVYIKTGLVHPNPLPGRPVGSRCSKRKPGRKMIAVPDEQMNDDMIL